MTHTPCFQVKALHSLCTLSPVPSSSKPLPEMEPTGGGHELQGHRVWRGVQLRECTASLRFLEPGLQELKSPSALHVVRSLKCSSDVFAYLKIRERQEDKREESVHGRQ